jgi:hypothetical protein
MPTPKAADAAIPPLLPLIVGVTGHRDLRDEDVPALEARVTDVFRGLRAQCPGTPLILLTPLAEGGDRLVTRVALRLRDDGWSIRVIAPLPMPRQLYEQDFRLADAAESASLAEFRDLLTRVDEWFELPLAPGTTAHDVGGDGTIRDKQYERLGAFVAAHSQVLVALWDGRPSEKTGATARVVDFALNGLPAEYAPERGPIDQLELGPVYHIVTPRRSHPETRYPAFAVRPLSPARFGADAGHSRAAEGSAKALYDRVFQRLEMFNRDVRRHRERVGTERDAGWRDILGDGDSALVTDGVGFLLDCYAATDALARVFRRTTDATRLALFLLAFVTAVAFGVYAHLGHWPPLLLVYGALLAVTFSVYVWGAPIERPDLLERVLGADAAHTWWSQRGDFQNKSQDYRALAEGLRVQLFWRLAGVPDSAADHYMLKQKSELDWIRVALRNWTLLADHSPRAESAGPDGPDTGEDGPDAGRLRLVLARWVRSQEAYFRNAALRDRAELRRLTRRAKWALALGTLSTVALGVSLNFPVPWRGRLAFLLNHHEMSHGMLTAVILALLIVAALMYAYADEKVLEDHVKQYLRMQLVFSDAARRLQRMLDGAETAEAKRLILSLGREALIENGDWVIAHRSRPLEIHAG